jgi:hypothetical protein
MASTLDPRPFLLLMGSDAGNPFTIVGPYGETLYPSPRSNPTKYRPAQPLRREMRHAITQYAHAQMVTECTQLACAIPVLSGALRQMSEWAFAGDSWQPIFYGDDEPWGDLAEDYLIHEVFPNCVRRTPNKSLIKAVQISAKGWLAQGDDLALFGYDENKTPCMTIIPSTMIGNGDIGTGWWSALTVTSGLSLYANPYGFGICVGGRYDGYRIYNGVIYDDKEEPIAARVLGWKPGKGNGQWEPTYTDFQLGFQYGAHMAFPYDWHGMGRPMPRIASAAIAWKDFQERDDYFQKGIKLAASKTVIHKLPPGSDAPMARGDGVQQITVTDFAGNEQSVYVETIDGGDVTYIGSDEDLQGMEFKTPHPNVEDFAIRKLRESVFDLGWLFELIDLSSTGRAPTRLGCELVNNSIWQLQTIGEERMFWFVKFAIADAIANGKLPAPKGSPDQAYKWTFGYPKEMTVDEGNVIKAQLDMLRYGLTSQRISSAKWGYVLKRIRRDRQKEVAALIEDVETAKKLVTKAKLDIPDMRILEFFWQPSANSAAVLKDTAADNNPDVTGGSAAPAKPAKQKPPAE